MLIVNHFVKCLKEYMLIILQTILTLFWKASGTAGQGDVSIKIHLSFTIE